MLPPLTYLAWARRHYGQVRMDLATSGLCPITAREVLAMEDGQSSPAPDDHGAQARFRAAVATRYGVPENHVVPGLGASGGIWLVLATLLARGDDVLVEDPSYEPLHAVATGLGARVRRFGRSPAQGFALDVDAIMREVRDETRIVTISNPHNPSAAFAGDEIVRELAAELAARNVVLLVDEAYRELVSPRTTAHVLSANVCAVSSMTKCFGMGWTRAGWALVPPGLAERSENAVAHVCGYLPPSSFGFGTLGLMHADSLLARGARLQDGKLALLIDFAARHERELLFTRPAGHVPFAFFVDRRGADLLAPIEAGVVNHGVLVAPGCFFGHPPGFRLSFTAPREVVADGLVALRSALSLA